MAFQWGGTPWGNAYGTSLGYITAPAPTPTPPQAPAQGTTTLKKFLMQEGENAEPEEGRPGVSYGMRRAAEAGQGLAVADHGLTKVASLGWPGMSTARALAAAGLTYDALDAMGNDYTVGQAAWDSVPLVGGSQQGRVLDRWAEVFNTIPNAPGARAAGGRWTPASGTTPDSTWDLKAALNEYMDQPHLQPGPQDEGGPGGYTGPSAPGPPSGGMMGDWGGWSWG